MKNVRGTSRVLRGAIVVAIAALAACSSSPEPVAPAGSSSTEPTSAEPTSSAAETARPLNAGSEATSPIVTKVVKIDPSKESEMYLHVMISFENKNEHPCTVTSYGVTWPGGSKEIKKDFTIPPKETVQRSMKVHPDDGKLDSLKPDAATTMSKSDCGAG